MKSPQAILIALVLPFSAAMAEEFDWAKYDTSKVEWSDADSGKIDGVPFRLANVDAPETGEIGSAHGAQCEAEQDYGILYRRKMRELTRRRVVTVSKDYGADPYNRRVVDLIVNLYDLDYDVGAFAMQQGWLKAWPHEGHKALAPKPDWCSFLSLPAVHKQFDDPPIELLAK
ncbi:MAG: thermonuclease family protein [Amphiplicatus sp.]|nr:thermonuclease family protein [Amphiplicatus sp.]